MNDLVLSSDVALSLSLDYTATGTTQITPAAGVDMTGYDGVIFIGKLYSFNAGNYIKALQSVNSDLSSSADLAGSKVTPTADNSVFYIDIVRPTKRYVGISVVRAGATSIIGSVYAIRYRTHNPLPLSNSSSTLIGKTLSDPTEGAA